MIYHLFQIESNGTQSRNKKNALIVILIQRNPSFLPTVSRSVQYGPYIKRLIPYLTHYQVHFFGNEQKNSFKNCFWFISI
ncbi:hypothetical protein CW304_20900 [Bacillus sp. UFRGS-B20]|nr:hypothetical protein CW304_20900 [Bacillus sp. UFRGS-B20]